MPYEVTIHTVRPATAPRAVAAMQGPLAGGPGKLLACWYSEIGALNRILVIREYESTRDFAAQREALGAKDDPFGINEFLESTASDSFESFPFIEPMQAGSGQGPISRCGLIGSNRSACRAPWNCGRSTCRSASSSRVRSPRCIP